jgi:hypothetical protein
VGVDVRTHLDLFDLDDLLVLAGFRGLLLRLVLELPEVENLADRRRGIRRDLDEVETGLRGSRQRVVDVDDAEVVTGFADQLNLRDADFTVDARAFLGRRGGSERTTNGW